MNGEAGLWRSLTLRLGIIYVALFLTSTAALFGSAYWFAVYRPLQREAALVRTEIGSLQAIDRAGGRDALIRALTVRRKTGPKQPFDALLGTDGTVILSNLPRWPAAPLPRCGFLDSYLSFEGPERE